MTKEITEYFNKTIYPFYCDKIGKLYGDHVKRVIQKSFDFAKTVESEPINMDMVFVIGAFHDIGLIGGKKDHEKRSAQMFLEDKEITKFFDKTQIKTIAEAIEDHRASKDGDPRTIYGKIVSTADRLGWMDLDEALRVQYSLRLKMFPEYSLDEKIEDARLHVIEKFSPSGYIDGKFYFKTDELDEFRKEFVALANDKEKFKQEFLRVNGLR
ncbi:MAG: HD domain-containing protein [Firmicutes bacterium]|nr:HD domain-containing protein [Bacillota bacterium]